MLGCKQDSIARQQAGPHCWTASRAPLLDCKQGPIAGLRAGSHCWATGGAPLLGCGQGPIAGLRAGPHCWAAGGAPLLGCISDVIMFQSAPPLPPPAPEPQDPLTLWLPAPAHTLVHCKSSGVWRCLPWQGPFISDPAAFVWALCVTGCLLSLCVGFVCHWFPPAPSLACKQGPIAGLQAEPRCCMQAGPIPWPASRAPLQDTLLCHIFTTLYKN